MKSNNPVIRRHPMARDREINEIIGDKVEKIRDRMEENVGKFRERIDDARERFEDVADQARAKGEEAWKRGEEGWKDVVKFTQKNPGQALGLALVIGAAVGVILFGGRRSD